MMKRFLLILLMVVLVSGLILGGCAKPTPTPAPAPAPAPAPKVIELNYATHTPPQHLISVMFEQWWIKEIEEQTNGRVKIHYFPGGSLVPGPKIYDGVVEGITDIGHSTMGYTPGVFPAMEMFELPHGFPSGWVATKAAMDFYNKYKPAEWDDVHVFFFHSTTPGVICTVKEPVRKLEDLKGMIIRGTGIGGDVVKKLGAEHYGASMAEVYELMAKGVVDGSIQPAEVLRSFRQVEVVKYVTGLGDAAYATVMFFVMNKDKWDSLPSDIQTIFTQVNEEFQERPGHIWDYMHKAAIDEFVTFPGREVIELSPEESARWSAAVKPLIDDYIAAREAKGLPAREYHEYALERVKYWSERAPTLEESVAWTKANILPLVPAAK